MRHGLASKKYWKVVVVALIFGSVVQRENEDDYVLMQDDPRAMVPLANPDGTIWTSMSHTKWCRALGKSPGLLYVKIPKTGSSTNVGINIRIAIKVAERLRREWKRQHWWRSNVPPVCSYTYYHGRDQFLNRQDPYLLWSFVRDPAARALSEYYHFHVSREKRLPTSANLEHFLNRRRNYQFTYLADYPNPESLVQSVTSFSSVGEDLIQRYILEPYHFVGLLERKFESLAVMKLLWGLEAEDLIVLSAKTSGGYDDGRFHGSCVQIRQPPKLFPPSVQQFIDNNFYENNLDYQLYDMVNRSLDYTIRGIGRDVVDREVQKLEALQHVAERRCQEKAIFPCSANGTLQVDAAAKECYWTDSGCGYKCVDESVLRSNI